MMKQVRIRFQLNVILKFLQAKNSFKWEQDRFSLVKTDRRAANHLCHWHTKINLTTLTSHKTFQAQLIKGRKKYLIFNLLLVSDNLIWLRNITEFNNRVIRTTMMLYLRQCPLLKVFLTINSSKTPTWLG